MFSEKLYFILGCNVSKVSIEAVKTARKMENLREKSSRPFHTSQQCVFRASCLREVTTRSTTMQVMGGGAWALDPGDLPHHGRTNTCHLAGN